MRGSKVAILAFLIAAPAFGRARISGYCEQGGQVVVGPGNQQSTNKVQQSYPQCSVTVFYTGGAMGNVSTSGTAVTLLSGTLFNANSGWSGLTITINSVAYAIASVASPTALTLTSSAGTQVSTIYSMPATAPAAIFSNDTGTVLANPFAASTTGYWGAYVDDGVYDVRMSGGGIPAPFTWGAISVIDAANVPVILSDSLIPRKYATLQALCTAASTLHQSISVTHVDPVTASFSCSASLIFEGGRIVPASGQTVTFMAQAAPLSQICDISNGGHCAISGSTGVLYPQWWGVKTDGTDTSAALKEAIEQSASDTVPQTLLFPPSQNYKLSAETDPQGYFNMDCGGLNQVTITTTGAITAINHTGNAVSMLGCTWRQSDTAAAQFLHAKRSGGGLSGNVRGNTFVSLSATAVSAVVLEDNVNTLVRDNFFAGPCYSCADAAGPTTTRTAIGLQLTAPVGSTNTTVGLIGNYFQGWKYGFDVTGGYDIQVTNVNIFQNNWIGIHGVGGPAGSFRWGIDGDWFENNKYLYSGSTGNGGAFFGDPANPTTNTLAVAPRLVIVTQNNYYNGNNDFIGGPSIMKSLNYSDVSAGTTDMNYSLGGADAAHSKAFFQRTVASDEPIVDIPCGNPDVTKPCIESISTTSQQAGQLSKIWKQMKTLDAATAPWYHQIRAEGATLYIESVNDPLAPSTWNPIHFPNGTGSDITIGGGTGNAVVPGDVVALNANGTMRIGAQPIGTFGVAGGYWGTTTNVDVTGVRNSVPIMALRVNGVQVITGNFISSDGTSGHTGASCSAWKNGICTAP